MLIGQADTLCVRLVKGHALVKPESVFKNDWLLLTTSLVSAMSY